MKTTIFLFVSAIALATTPINSQEKIQYDQAKVTLINNLKISSEDSGIMAKISVQHGTTIDAGQELARLDDSLYQAEHKAARTERKIAELQAANDINHRFAMKSQEVN